MPRVACLFAIALMIVGCAQLYTPTSKNPALVRMPPSGIFGVGDQINLVATDGISVDANANAGGEWRIDPGPRRLTITYEASRKIVGPRVAASPLILSAKLEPGMAYRVIVEASDIGVKAFLRQESTNRTVSNVAETSLISAPLPYPSATPLLVIPAAHRR
jgi:hypothetical protein